jgi:hypothetical protein
MKFESRNYIISRRLDPIVFEFLSRTLKTLGEEFSRVANAIFIYPDDKKGIDGKESVNDVFALIERSHVGILNNAILRAFPNDTTLQEFAVYEKNGHSVGRADLFVKHVASKERSIDFLFEAKAGVFLWKNYSEDETRQFYERIQEQAYKYYLAEKEYYTHPTYIISIIFDWIRHTELLNRVLSEEYSDNVTDFYLIFHTKEAGLSVSGNVQGPLFKC